MFLLDFFFALKHWGIRVNFSYLVFFFFKYFNLNFTKTKQKVFAVELFYVFKSSSSSFFLDFVNHFSVKNFFKFKLIENERNKIKNKIIIRKFFCKFY